jgi:C4-dicarboxylate transporter DctQ subunit
VAFVQVFCRYTLGISFSWFEEGGRYMGIAITFLGAAIGARRGDHFAMDLVMTSVGATKAKIMKVAVGLISGSVLALVAAYGVKIVMRQYAYENTTPAMQIPMYLVYIPIPLFALVMALRFFKSSWAAFREKNQVEERTRVEKRSMVEEGGKA